MQEWNRKPLARSRKMIAAEAGRLVGKAGFSVKNIPIPRVPVDPYQELIFGIPPDVLHAGMRVPERVMKHLVEASREHTGDKYAVGLQDLVRGIKIPFKIYEASVRGQVQICFSSLTGRNWKLLLQRIGPALKLSTDILPTLVRDKFASLFQGLHELLSFAAHCTTEDAPEVSRMSINWVQEYVKMGFTVTPYIHILGVHLAFSVSVYGGLAKMSGEWVENANDSLKRTHLKRTDRRHPRQTLRTQLRIEYHEAQARLDAKNAKIERKRKATVQHPWQGFGLKARNEQDQMNDRNAREEATRSQKSPLEELSIKELQNLIHEKTGKRTRKKTKETLIVVLQNLNEYPEGEMVLFTLGHTPDNNIVSLIKYFF